jgi:hypothetical protein
MAGPYGLVVFVPVIPTHLIWKGFMILGVVRARHTILGCNFFHRYIFI